MKLTVQTFNSTIVCLVSLFLCHSVTNAVIVRLQGGPNQCEGRLEVLSGTVFGSACDRSFSTEEAKVVCRQLGCPSTTSTRVDANFFSPRTNFLQAFDYDCSGTENSIADCDLVGATCSPSSDTVGVMCTTPSVLVPECPLLPNITNGEVTQTGTSPGSQALYTCDGGFVVMGNGTRVCQADGQWSGSTPTCESSTLADIPLWFNQTQLCYKWRPDGNGGQCGAGEPRDLCAIVGSQTQYYRDDTDNRGGGCRMQWAIESPDSESWFQQVQICYRWFADGSSGQCGGGVPNEICASVGTYTQEYRDDTDGRPGGCRMSWKLSIPSNSPQWLVNAKLCYQWFPDGDGGQCGGGVARSLCATANSWTTYYRDDTDGRGGGCRMSWGLHI